jgi:tetratricopeptide (TPR) repeat protein
LRSAARAAARRQDWLSAARHYEALIQTGRAHAGDRIQLGHARKELGDMDAALHAYAEAALTHPMHLDAQRQYGLYLRRVGREAGAVDILARALALEPEAADIRAEIADMGVTDATTLDRHFLQGILSGNDARPRDRPGLIGRILAARAISAARRCARGRDWRSAEDQYRTALRHAPDRVGARVQLGHALLEQGRAEEALACYRRALVPAPREPDLYLHVGHALKALERRESAFDAYLTAWRLQPGSAAAFDEIRGLRPEIEKAALLSGAGLDTGYAEAGLTGGGSRRSTRRRLAPPRGLGHREEAVFKYLSGSISYKE